LIFGNIPPTLYVGETMATRSHGNLYWAVALVAFVGALGLGWYGVLLLAASLSPNGSGGGNALLAIIGVLFVLAAAALVFSGNLAVERSRLG
jgi:hypothetical protein